MRCCLCPNEESLLIQVQSGSGLSLMLCPACEETPIFEVAARLAVENEKLSNTNEELKIDLSVQWGRGDVLAKENEKLRGDVRELKQVVERLEQLLRQTMGIRK